MPRLREDVPENLTATGDVSEGRKSRLSFKLTDEGYLDMSDASPKMKERLTYVLTNDPAIKPLVAARTETETAVEDKLTIREKHVRAFMEGFSFVSAQVMPRVIAAKTKGAIQIPPSVAAVAYTFTEEQKRDLAPAGAEWANNALPEKLRRFLLEMGPGAQFFGGMAMCLYAQTKAALEMMQRQNQPVYAANGANGHATEEIPLAVGEDN